MFANFAKIWIKNQKCCDRRKYVILFSALLSLATNITAINELVCKIVEAESW